MNAGIQIGHRYPCGQNTMGVVCASGNQVMLEKWHGETLVGYVVAIDPHMFGGNLVWLQGAHYPCGENAGTLKKDTPFESFRKAWNYLNGEQTVFSLVEDTSEGTDVRLYSTMDLAKQALQLALDGNEEIQSISENLGIAPLTVEAYLGGALADIPLPMDEYRIMPRIIDRNGKGLEDEAWRT